MPVDWFSKRSKWEKIGLSCAVLRTLTPCSLIPGAENTEAEDDIVSLLSQQTTLVVWFKCGTNSGYMSLINPSILHEYNCKMVRGECFCLHFNMDCVFRFLVSFMHWKYHPKLYFTFEFFYLKNIPRLSVQNSILESQACFSPLCPSWLKLW